MKSNRTVVGVDTAERVFQLHWVNMSHVYGHDSNSTRRSRNSWCQCELQSPRVRPSSMDSMATRNQIITILRRSWSTI